MIRLKNRAVDFKRFYSRDLWASLGLAALLPALVFVIDPELAIEAMQRVRQPMVIELEQIPPTKQRLPRPPLPQRAVPVAMALPARDYDLPPPVVVTEFPLEAEEEVAELWMVEREPAVVRRVVPAYPDSARTASVEGKVFARVLVGREGQVEHIDRISGPLVFHRAVALAAKEWEFTPAVQNDQTVKVWVSLPFVFALE